jgi:tyrosyl-tRNA synthetase
MVTKTMKIGDELMWRWFELLSFEVSLDDLASMKRDVASGALNPRDIKVALAKELVERFHSPAAADAALADFEARFRQGEMPKDMPHLELYAPSGGVQIPQLLKEGRLAPSTSAARRLIAQGGVRLDGNRVSDEGLMLQAGTEVVVQVGKRHFARITLKPAPAGASGNS